MKLLKSHLTLCVTLFILGWADCILTVCGIASHKGYEANPLMAWVLSFGYGAFIWTKMTFTGLVCYMLHRLAPGVEWSLRVIQAVNIIYLLVVVYQIIGISVT